MTLGIPPLSLYVHLPWCVRKCPYCDFNSHTTGKEIQRTRYLDAISADLVAESDRAGGRRLISVFLGGGTPSLFAPAEIERLLTDIDDRFTLDEHAEITMEANPGTVEYGDPAGYRSAGVNRLSIGAQSFNDRHLKTLGRIHGSEEISKAFDAARGAGFDDINLDLMFALPGQRLEEALEDLRCALALRPTHISWYQLTLEPNTVFHARPPSDLPDDDTSSEIQHEGQALLADSGFESYEISAFARGGRRCRHNVNYWTFGDYLAVGAGAHGKLTTVNGVFRYAKTAHPVAYMRSLEDGPQDVAMRQLTDADLMFEFMLNILRLTAGFDERLFCERTGLGGRSLRDRLAPLVARDLVGVDEKGVWRPTELGRRFTNDLQSHFLPE